MIHHLTLAGALLVCSDMRPGDAACVRAMAGCEPGEWFAAERFQRDGVGLELTQDGKPWAICGLSFPNSWTGILWMVARPGLTGESWRKLIRRARIVLGRVTDPACSEYRHRVEAHVLEGWTEAADFAGRLGFQLEHTRAGGGSGGENLQTWVMLGQPRLSARPWR